MNDTELTVTLAARFGLCVGKDAHGRAYIGRPGAKDVVLFFEEGKNAPEAQLIAVVHAVASLGDTPLRNGQTMEELAAFEREHLGDPDTRTGIYADRSGVSVEARTYPDGTTATGLAPLPTFSPAVQGLLERALSFAEEVWHGKLSKDDREGAAFNLRCAIREYLAREVQACQTCDGRGEVPTVEYADGMHAYLSSAPCPDCNGTGNAGVETPREGQP